MGIMARKGDVIENPITGEKIVFLQTAKDTNGEILKFDLFVQPGGFVPAEHIHPKQDEEFEVISGRLALFLKGEKTIGEKGFKTTVKAGTSHIWVNDGEDELHCRLLFRPALKWEQMFETMFGLARDGRSDKKGLPNLLQLSVMTNEFKDHAWLAKPPIPVQRFMFFVLNPIGKLIGYKATYPKYTK
jgi:quercetin dioxygenase-like cupin family protein